MTATLVRKDQIRKSDSFDDTLDGAAVAGIESSAVDDQDFLTGVLSQFKRIIHGSDSGNWHDDIATTFGGAASLKALYNRATLEGKNILTYRLNLADCAVQALENWVLLTGGTKPASNIAIGGSAQGAVCAKLAGAIGSHSLTEIAGSNALKPKSMVMVFDGASGDAVMSSDRRVYGLLQVGSAATDGNPFGNTGSDDQGQISFVRANATYDDLEACPVGDIAGKSVIYGYTCRDDMSDTPEDAFRGDIDSADPQPGVTVSLDAAYDGGAIMTVDGSDVDIRLDDTKSWVFRAGSGGGAIVTVTRNDDDGDLLQVDADNLDVNSTTNDFAQGVVVDSADQALNLGVTATGQIDSASMAVKANTGDLVLESTAGDITFTTDEESTPIPLDDGTTGPISGLFGGSQPSIAAAIKWAGEHGGVDMGLKVTTLGSSYAQGANIPGAVQDLSLYPIDMNTAATVTQLVFLNGRLLVGGNGTTKNDAYAGTTPASGDLKVDFKNGVKTGDVIISIVLAQ